MIDQQVQMLVRGVLILSAPRNVIKIFHVRHFIYQLKVLIKVMETVGYGKKSQE